MRAQASPCTSVFARIERAQPQPTPSPSLGGEGDLHSTIDAASGLVTFTAPPPAGRLVTADFTYYFRVRFSDDTAEFENFMIQLWQARQIKLQSAFL